MGEAFAWGLLAASSLVLGAVVPLWFDLPRVALGLIMALGSGVLIATVAYELVVDPHIGDGALTVGLAGGALVFFAGDVFIGRMGGGDRKRPEREDANAEAIVLGTILDGIPESIVLGLTLLTGDGVSLAMVSAIFLSNVPESLGSTPVLLKAGRGASRILLMWVGVAVICGVSAAVGYGLLEDASHRSVAIIQAFAGGALLTMVADTMMPSAFAYGGRAAGLMTTAGFALAAALATLD